MNHKAYNLMTSTILAVAGIGLAATSAQAAIIVTPDHIQGVPLFAVQGTLMAIDVPSSDETGAADAPGGPDWTEDADDGFSMPAATITNFMFNDDSRPGWEPDGTDPFAAHISWMWNQKGQSVTYAFDLPDGAIIHNVFATWYHQGNSLTGHTYTYDEGTLTTFTRTVADQSAGDLVLQWEDSNLDPHDETFERIFAGDITVAGGDGFVVTFTQFAEGGNAFPYIDAVVLDFTAAPVPFEITEIVHDPDAETVTLTWGSKPGEEFFVKYSTDMTNWDADLDDGVIADAGDSTTRTYGIAGIAGEGGKLFFRVEK